MVVSNEVPLPTMRKFRSEGIYCHALKPAKPEDIEEISQVVQCALGTIVQTIP